jgi:hypothetical protein
LLSVFFLSPFSSLCLDYFPPFSYMHDAVGSGCFKSISTVSAF